MKHIVLGTAGHVDHGKTRLTEALTGVDTDHLAEEKARGITIELGFAPLPTESGAQVSIVDVPGHEKFVKTMMAGAAGVDGVLFVVAADEGVMPQTREHLDILELLRVRQGILVITKRDLVSEQELAAVTEEIREAVAHTFLQDAPVYPVSTVTGEGIPALKAGMEALIASIGEKDGERPARLPVDRAFQVRGFGMVATGTLTDGSLSVGQSVEIYPAREKAAVRTLQNHNETLEQSVAGMRTAVSLTGSEHSQLRRGDTLAEPDSMLVTTMVDVWLQITPDCPYPIKNASQLHLFHGTEEVVCKLRLLDADKLTAGQSGYAQLSLNQPIALRNGDRFLLRFFSPVLTIGGGRILDGQAVRRRRKHPQVLERLERLNSPSEETVLLQRVADGGAAAVDGDWLCRVCNGRREDFRRTCQGLLADGRLVSLGGSLLMAGEVLEQQWEKVRCLVEDFHREYPLQPGIPVALLRSKAFPQGGAPIDRMLARFVERGELKLERGAVSRPDFQPVFTQQHKIMQRKLLHYYRDAWFLAPNQKDVDEKFTPRGPIYPQVLANMRLNGMLVSLSPRYAVHFEAYRQALEIFAGLFAQSQQVTLGQFRTAAGISRKYAQLFLEHWDREGICKRVGEGRVLLRRPEDFLRQKLPRQ